MINMFSNIISDSGATLTSVYALSPPDPLAVEAREARVKEVIARMGDKYLLAKLVVRINDRSS